MSSPMPEGIEPRPRPLPPPHVSAPTATPLRQTKDMLHDSMQQTREALQVAKKATAATRLTLDAWLGRTGTPA